MFGLDQKQTTTKISKNNIIVVKFVHILLNIKEL